LVESIGGIDGTPPTSNTHSMHMHGFVGANYIVTSNPIVVATISNYVVVASNFASNSQPTTREEVV
jgi:hypothetical protein